MIFHFFTARCWWQRTLVLMDFSSIFQIASFFLFRCSARSTVAEISSIKGQTESMEWAGQSSTHSQQASTKKQRENNKKFIKYLSKNIMYLMVQNRESKQRQPGISAEFQNFHCDDDTRRCWAHLAAQHKREKKSCDEIFSQRGEIKNNEISSNCWTELWIIKKPNFIIFHICETTDKVCGLELCNMIEINYPVNQFSMLLKQPSSRLYSCLTFFSRVLLEKPSPIQPSTIIISPRFSHEGARFFCAENSPHSTSCSSVGCLIEYKSQWGELNTL